MGAGWGVVQGDTTILRGLWHRERPKKANIGQCSREKYIRKKPNFVIHYNIHIKFKNIKQQ